MEFSYAVGEAEYIQAWKLRQKSVFGKSATGKTVLFWIFILVCLLLLWAVVNWSPGAKDSRTTAPVAGGSQPSGHAISKAKGESNSALHTLENVGPMVLLAVVWLLTLRAGPSRVRRIYRNNPAMQGQFTVNITQESISTQTTAGTSSKNPWSVCESWSEGKDLIVLVMRSQSFFILNLAGLSDLQRYELRGILASALPRK